MVSSKSCGFSGEDRTSSLSLDGPAASGLEGNRFLVVFGVGIGDR